MASFLMDLGVKPSCMIGHSLGEYAAMFAAEMISLEDTFKIIKIRAEHSDRQAEKKTGKMAAVLKLSAAEIQEVIDNSGRGAVIANYNSPTQNVIAGLNDDVDKLCEELSETGARVMPIKVSGAFHCGQMSDAAGLFYEQIKDIKFREPTVPFYSNLTGARVTDFRETPTRLARHMCLAVRFTEELRNMRAAGIDTFIELGPGKILSGLVKKTLDDVKIMTLNDF